MEGEVLPTVSSSFSIKASTVAQLGEQAHLWEEPPQSEERTRESGPIRPPAYQQEEGHFDLEEDHLGTSWPLSTMHNLGTFVGRAMSAATSHEQGKARTLTFTSERSRYYA